MYSVQESCRTNQSAYSHSLSHGLQTTSRSQNTMQTSTP